MMQNPAEFGSTPLAGEVCDALPLAPPEPAELLRYLGYPAAAQPDRRMIERIETAASDALPCLQPRGVYALYAAGDSTPHSLALGGVAIAGNIGKFLGPSRRIAVFVVTVGEAISHGAPADPFAAWVRDCVGSWAAEHAADALMQRLRRHLAPGEDLTLRYSPGYCGMEMREQRQLFQLVDAARAGVTLLPSLLMHPLKSISGLVGLAPQATLAQHRSPCELCPKTQCHMRR